jgi:hypothetical protein
MTDKEHELMVLMFARMFEAIATVTDTLKSRGLWTADDEKAFRYAVHADDAKLLGFVAQATVDYIGLARRAGVVTGLE